MKNYSGGFTLIELMVVISVISFLSTFTFTAFKANRVKTVDTTRAISTQTYVDVLNQIYWDTGKYPDPEAENTATQNTAYCLGNPSIGYCLGNQWAASNNDLNNILAPYLTNITIVDVPRIGTANQYGITDYSGIYYKCDHYFSDTNNCKDTVIRWVAEPTTTGEAGAAACKIPNSFCENNFFGLTKCSLILENGETAEPNTQECSGN